jgi:glutaminyl-tRNA synthetase
LIDEQPNDKDEESQKYTLNPNSLIIKKGYVESSLSEALPMQRYQFVRHGYFCVDIQNTDTENLIFNLIVSLKSSWKPV